MICPDSSAFWGGVEAAQYSPGAGTTGTPPVAEYEAENDTTNKKLKIKRTVLFSCIGSLLPWFKNGCAQADVCPSGQFETTLSEKKLIVSSSQTFNTTPKVLTSDPNFYNEYTLFPHSVKSLFGSQ
jgi:hypothetical protein